MHLHERLLGEVEPEYKDLDLSARLIKSQLHSYHLAILLRAHTQVFGVGKACNPPSGKSVLRKRQALGTNTFQKGPPRRFRASAVPYKPHPPIDPTITTTHHGFSTETRYFGLADSHGHLRLLFAGHRGDQGPQDHPQGTAHFELQAMRTKLMITCD